MPRSSVPFTVPFTPEYTVTGWLEPPGDAGGTVPIATGRFGNARVTFVIDHADGHVRAEPEDPVAAAAGLKGFKAFRYWIYSVLGLDSSSRAMRNLWRLSESEGTRFFGLSVAGFRAQRACAALQQRLAPNKATLPAAGMPEPAVAEAAPLPPGVQPGADARCSQRPRAGRNRPATAIAPCVRKTSRSALAHVTITLEAIGADCLRLVLGWLDFRTLNAVALANQSMRTLALEQIRWYTLEQRCEATRTAADIQRIVRDIGCVSGAHPLTGKREREATILQRLAWRAVLCAEPVRRARNVVAQLLEPIRSLPKPAQYKPLVKWLYFMEFVGDDGPMPSGLPLDLYEELPAAHKAQLCNLLYGWTERGRFDPRPTGLHGDGWLNIARHLSPAELARFTHAVLESRRKQWESIQTSWPDLSAAVDEVLNAAMVALDNARRAAVICGLMSVAPAIFRDHARRKADGAMGPSLWDRLLCAVPATEAWAALDALVEAFSSHSSGDAGDALVEEVKVLMDRVNREKPGALSATQRQEILLRLSKGLSDAERDSCWLALMDACEDPRISSTDPRRMAFVLADTAAEVCNDTAWHRLLAFCDSPRLCPADQARVLARLERGMRESSLESYTQSSAPFETALRLAQRDGPLEGVIVLLPRLPEHLETPVLALLSGRADEDKRDVVGLLKQYPAKQRLTTAVFGLMSLPAKLDWIGSSYTLPQFVQQLLSEMDSDDVAPNRVARVFDAVVSFLSGGQYRNSMQPKEVIPLLAPLRATLTRHPCLASDVGAWTRTLVVIEMVASHHSIVSSTGNASAVARERDLTWRGLRAVAPQLEKQVVARLADKASGRRSGGGNPARR